MSPEEYMPKYLKMKVVLADNSVREVAIDRYLNHGKIDSTDSNPDIKIMSARAKDAQAALDALRGAVANDLARQAEAKTGIKPKNQGVPLTFFIDGKRFELRGMQRSFWGKGSPQEICNVLWLASKFKLLTAVSLDTYCNTKLGLDCNGFASNYWGMTNPAPENASTYLFNVRPRTRIGDIRNGDAIVEYDGSRSDIKHARHVAVVAGAPSASGNVLTFDRVQSAGLNGNYGLEIEYGKKWELKNEPGDQQLYFQAAARRCYFAAGPAKKAVPR